MKHIITWHNIIHQYTRRLKSLVYIPSRQPQPARQVADAICYKINIITIHILIIFAEF